MSRYGPRSGDDLAYGEYDNRWDRERFDRSRLPPQPPEPPRRFEEDFRFQERDRPGRREIAVEDRVESRGPRGRIDERERIFRETFGDSARRRTDRELFGDVDPRDLAAMAMTPYKGRGSEKEIDVTIKETRAPRPGMLRRQSSLDTFNRRPIPRYDKDERDEYRMAPYTPIPLPIRRREDEDRLGEDNYREVEVKRERSVHRRSGKKSRISSVASSSSSSDTEVETKVSRPPGLKKGKTRVPKRLVFREAIQDLGYPFIEEEHFYILQVALEKEQIDEVIRTSEIYKSSAKHKSFRYEEKVEEFEDETESVSKVDVPERKGRETIIRKEYINPPSDFQGSQASVRSRSSRRAHSPSIESSISQRLSPVRSLRPRARSSFREERATVIEAVPARSRAPTLVVPAAFEGSRTIIEERVPSGALILPERDHRTDHEIHEEIMALEAERRALRLEREGDMQLVQIREERPREEIVKIVERERERSPPRNVVRVEKDRKARRGPNPRVVAAAMAALT